LVKSTVRKSEQRPVSGIAKQQCLVQHRIEYRREVARRGINDAQHLGGRGLSREGLVTLGQRPG
jgi:hypothetical protein